MQCCNRCNNKGAYKRPLRFTGKISYDKFVKMLMNTMNTRIQDLHEESVVEINNGTYNIHVFNFRLARLHENVFKQVQMALNSGVLKN